MDSVSVVAGQNAQFAVSEERKDNQSSVSVRTGVSQATAITYATEMIGITANTSFLLLDLREADEYNLWRIKESVNFPAPNIARDKMIPDLYRFKNQQDKLIVVYMFDERQGTQYAQMFTEKGFDNLYLLSGGCEEFLEKFSDLCEGRQVPVPKSKIAADEAARHAEKKELAR
jgi:centrosomal protein CEP41